MAEQCSAYEVAFRLTRRRSSVPRARAVLRAAIDDWGVGQDVAESGELVLSELVTNALRVPVPADRQVSVRIARSAEGGVLRLEVGDAGAGTPGVRVPRDDETGGRGLLLVEALADRWGVEARAGGVGKIVWAELAAPRGGPAVALRPGPCVQGWGWSTWLVVPGARGARAAGPGVPGSVPVPVPECP